MVEKSTSEYVPSDWKKAFLDDSNFEQEKPFCYELCQALFEEAAKDVNNLNLYYLLRPIWEITKGFKTISSALSIGFSDITEKVQTWRSIYKTYYSDCNTVQEIIEKEISLGIHECNGDNNSDKGHKKKTKYYEYISGTRTLLRLTWFLDFFVNILTNTLTLEKKDFSDCVKIAYEKALAPHHGWLVRKGASLGMSFVSGKREKGLSAFFHREAYDDQTKKDLERWIAPALKLWTYLNNYYTEKKFLELP